MSGLVLAIFPGIDILGHGFEMEGYCVVPDAPWTMQGKRKAIGNAVPLPMARQLAVAVRASMEEHDA